ncbi:MAG: Flp pilus assembly protein CpaB [Candidatus Magnetomorum sp.]|nr:Flp pilus assembly protein CpaB [Candidatus Magnetomorum sp.]
MKEPLKQAGFQMNRKQSAIFFLAAIIFAGMASYLSRLWIASEAESAQQSQLKTASVVVAVHHMKKGHVLKLTDLAVQQWPLKDLPKGYYSQIKFLDGYLTLQEIIKGQAILKSSIAEKTSALGLSSIIADGKRAITLPVDEVIGVAGFVQPNDRVDVIATVDIGPYKETPVTKMILQNVKVLAVGEKVIEENEKKDKKKKRPKPIRVKVVTLEVTPQDTQHLALISSQCRIHLALCNEDTITQETNVKTGINIQTLFPKPKPVKKHSTARRSLNKKKDKKKDNLSDKKDIQIVEVIKGSTRSQINF